MTASASAPTRTPIEDPEGYRRAITAFSDVAVALSSDMDLDRLLHLVCDQLCSLIGISRASLFLKDPQSGAFKGQVARNTVDIDAYVKRYVAGTPADQFTREILRRREPVLVANAQSDPRPVRAQMRRWDIRSMLGVPMIQNDEVIGLVFLDNGDEPYPYTTAQQELSQIFANLAATAVAQAAAGSKLRASRDALSRQNELLKYISVVNDRLTALILGGATIAEIAGAISELAGNPCVIHDRSFRRIAEAGAGGSPDSVLDQPYRSHPALLPEIRSLREKRAALLGPALSAGLNRRFMVAPVTVRSECWGYLVIEERGTKFGKPETIVAQRAASIIALEMVSAERGAESEFDSRRALVADLIRGGDDQAELDRRAQRLNLDPRRPHLVAVARSRGEGPGATPKARELAEALGGGEGIADVLAAEIDDAVALVLEVDADSDAAAIELAKNRFEQARRGLRFGADLLVGISSPCPSARDYPRAHFEAAQILSILRQHGSPRATGEVFVLGSEELGVGRSLLASHPPERLEGFLEDTLGALLDEEDSRMTTLLETMDCYFGACRSTGRTATILGVHENSVRYRISRAEEISALKFSTEGSDLLEAQMAMAALRLRGRLGPAEGRLVGEHKN